MARISFRPKILEHLKAPAPGPANEVRQADYFDETTPGFGLRISSTGTRSWIFLARLQDGTAKLRRVTIGRYAARHDDAGLTLAAAREKAQELRKVVDRGQDPQAIAEEAARETREYQDTTFKKIADSFIERYAKKRNRSWEESERIFNKYCVGWHGLPIGDIKRRDVAALLDDVEDENGAVMADRVLAAVRKLFNWYASRDDDFAPPIAKGMARTNPKERARDRILSDDEIRALWRALDKMASTNDAPVGARTYAALVKLLLLSAQRRSEVAGMKRSAIDQEGVWMIAKEDYKTKRTQWVPLPDAARNIVAQQMRFSGSDLYFTTDGETSFAAFSKMKRQLDKLMAAELDVKSLPRWTHHDLRRTARTLLSRAKIPADHAELVLGHVLRGVRATYDRHEYLEEKRDALAALAEQVERIIGANVVALETARR